MAKMKRDLLPAVFDLPFFRQARFEPAQRLVVLDQPVEDVARILMRRAVGSEHRDERRRIADGTEYDRVAARGRGISAGGLRSRRRRGIVAGAVGPAAAGRK